MQGNPRVLLLSGEDSAQLWDPGWGGGMRSRAPAKDGQVSTSSSEIQWQQLPRGWQRLHVLEQEVGEGALRQHHPSQSPTDSGSSGFAAGLSLIPASPAEQGRKSLMVFTRGQ